MVLNDVQQKGLNAMKIAVCGKGGSGKSALVTLLAKQALNRGIKVLVVDSDESNSGLFRMFGFEKPPVPLMELVGGKASLKEKMSQANIFNESQIFVEDIPSQYIQRKNGLALVGIGKILQALEGCACPMGVLSREFLKKLRLTENEFAPKLNTGGALRGTRSTTASSPLPVSRVTPRPRPPSPTGSDKPSPVSVSA